MIPATILNPSVNLIPWLSKPLSRILSALHRFLRIILDIYVIQCIIFIPIYVGLIRFTELTHHDGLYICATPAAKDKPTYRFYIEFPFGYSSYQLWQSLLSAAFAHSTEAGERILAIKEDSGIMYTYGPDVRSLIDNHGNAIRTAGTKHDIEYALSHCACTSLYPEYVDPTVGHVRTQDTRILGKTLGPMAALGMNFRPSLACSHDDHTCRVTLWAQQVLQCRGFHRKPEIRKAILSAFRYRIARAPRARVTSRRPTTSIEALERLAAPLRTRLVCTGTDKAANACTIECKSYYRWICLQRLETAAFVPVLTEGITTEDVATAQNGLVTTHAPWGLEDMHFTPAILFCTAKMHKRAKDPLAYRYITSACSAWSNPVSIELTRVLSFLSKHVRSHCVTLGEQYGGKWWWAIGSLDVVPLNLDVSPRHGRCPAAYDLDKCFESIPLTEGEHSLVAHVEFFLELALPAGSAVACDYRWDGKPGQLRRTTVAGADAFAIAYDAALLLTMLRDLLMMAIITVGDTWRRQHVGIPMGFNSSVQLLNIYMFKPEYMFCWRLLRLTPELLPCTLEIFRYVDDLLNMSDLDLSTFLLCDTPQSTSDIHWIYPLAPLGPLGISDQTTRNADRVELIYLDIRYTYLFDTGALSMTWYNKSESVDTSGTARYTHWLSNVSRNCKLGILSSQVRSVVRSVSSVELLCRSLARLETVFALRGYPLSMLHDFVATKASHYISRLPVSYKTS
jgi:hypothetical protein